MKQFTNQESFLKGIISINLFYEIDFFSIVIRTLGHGILHSFLPRRSTKIIKYQGNIRRGKESCNKLKKKKNVTIQDKKTTHFRHTTKPTPL